MGWIEKVFGKDAVKTSDGKVFRIQELCTAAAEVSVRELALSVCINMIANAVGRCEFQTYQNGEPVRGREYYTWNIEPNINQNSSAFLHQMVDQLVRNNEVLMISTVHRDGHEMLVVADAWSTPERYPQKMQEYKNVRVGEVTYRKTFRENEVLHLILHNQDIRGVVDRLWDSYSKLYAVASRAYTWGQGTHLKVKVDQMPQSSDKDIRTFQQIMTEQVRPFLESENGVLPQYAGYDYSDMGGSANADRTTRDIRALIDDIFDFTALSVGIPPVLVKGVVEGTKDAVSRWMTTGIDPICDQLEEEINRKRYGFEAWQRGDYLHIDTSTVSHFDLFANAANAEKIIGSGMCSINDVLRAAGKPPIDADWANAHWLTLNIERVERAAREISTKKGGAE